MTLKEFYNRFPEKKDCIGLLEELKWENNPQCPYCGSEKFSDIKKTERYHCNNCNMSYSVTVNTVFHRTRLDLQKWFYAIDILLSSVTNISSRDLSKRIETTKDTAWLVIQKIKRALIENDRLIYKIHSHGK